MRFNTRVNDRVLIDGGGGGGNELYHTLTLVG